MRVKSASLAWPAWSTMAMLLLAGCAARPLSAPAPPVPPAASDRAGAGGLPEVAAPADASALMVRSAEAMLGQPYRYGGAAPGGFDCSGLVIFAAQSAGLRLPRTAKEQLHAGVRVSRGELRPGDLVFMRLAQKELHVGIVIGDGRFIHAPATGGRVRIDDLAAPPYSAGFLDARRVIGVGVRDSGF